jgi:hypothetical protein
MRRILAEERHQVRGKSFAKSSDHIMVWVIVGGNLAKGHGVVGRIAVEQQG